MLQSSDLPTILSLPSSYVSTFSLRGNHLHSPKSSQVLVRLMFVESGQLFHLLAPDMHTSVNPKSLTLKPIIKLCVFTSHTMSCLGFTNLSNGDSMFLIIKAHMFQRAPALAQVATCNEHDRVPHPMPIYAQLMDEVCNQQS